MSIPVKFSRLSFTGSHKAFALLFTCFYCVLLYYFQTKHELWFDETEAWLLGLYSDSYQELLQNKQYEGHPNLWYSILYVVTKFTTNLKALQITQLFFATGYVYLFLRYAPLSCIFKLFICFGYYGLFEYGVLSRLYAIELFFTFSICALYPKRFSHWYLYIFFLILNAHTNLFGFFLSGVLGLLLFSESFKSGKTTPYWAPTAVSHKWIGLFFWSTGCLFSFWSMLRPSEGDLSQIPFQLPYIYYQSAAKIWQSFVPIPAFGTQFWNTSYLRTTFEVPLSAFILVVVLLGLNFNKRLFWSLALLYLTLFLFFAYKMEGSLRHHGHYFVYTLAFLWIDKYYTTDQPYTSSRKWSNQLLRLVLLACGFSQVIAGAFAIYTDWKYPFYAGKEVAQFLKTLPSNVLITTTDAVTTSTISAYYGQPLHHLPTGDYKSFYVLDPHRANNLTPYKLLDWAKALAKQRNATVIVVSRTELAFQWYAYPIKPLASFRGDYITPYSLFVYEVSPLSVSESTMMAGYPVVSQAIPPESSADYSITH